MFLSTYVDLSNPLFLGYPFIYSMKMCPYF